MRFLRRSLMGLFLVCMTIGLLAVAGNQFYGAVQERMAQEGRAQQGRERVFAVNTVTVEAGEIRPELTTYGEVRARRTLELRTPAGGTIVELADAFEEGGQVAGGTVLLRVDPTNAEAALRVAQADAREADAELADAERGLELARDDLAAAESQLGLREAALSRQRNLADRGVATEADVETAALSEASARQAVLSRRQSLASAEARLDQSRNGVLRAEIALADAERALEDTVLKATFDGTLANVTAALGAIVTANEQVGTLIDPDALEVSFRVSTGQYTRLIDESGALIGLPVTASLDLDGVGLVAEGIINRESAAVGTGQTGRLLFARLSDAPGLRPGDFVTVRIVEPALQNVALLPAAAVDASETVLAVTADERLEVLDAPVLRRQGDDVIVEASAIAGRVIVRERSPLLGAGIRVRVSGGGAAASPEAVAPPQDEMISLSAEQRARLLAFVEGNQGMPSEARERLLAQLRAERVPAETVRRLESRMGS